MQTPKAQLEYLTLKKQLDCGLPDDEERILTRLREIDDTADNSDNRYHCDACRSCEHIKRLDRENTLLTERCKKLQYQLSRELGNSTRFDI
jgi:hypothetical protein